MESNNDDLYKKLLRSLESDSDAHHVSMSDDNGRYILPKAGFAIKTKNKEGGKVFMNILSSAELPEPKDISQQELEQLLEDPDSTQFRIPLAFGDPHAELDKKGNGCTVYDVVINARFLTKIREDNFFMGFFMTVVYEGIESKYNTVLSRDWIILKNKKCIGDISQHKIRNRRKPVIEELNPTADNELREVSTKRLSSVTPEANMKDISTREPLYEITLEPAVGYPDFLIVEISLPDVKSVAGAVLDVGVDQLIFDFAVKRYYLDLNFPHNVDYESGGAQFNRKSKMLTVTIPVLKTSER